MTAVAGMATAHARNNKKMLTNTGTCDKHATAKMDTAKNTLQEGLPVELILKLTGLAPEALAQLRAAAQPPQA